jgi:uncharacterized protein YhfF
MQWTEEELSKLQSFSFGDSPKLADELLSLVIHGNKRATCGALRDYRLPGAPPLPKAGRQDIVLDGNGRRACIIQTTEVTIRKFKDVDEDFAVSEGEGPYEDWKRAHIDYFSRNGGYDPEMELVCERFKLIYVFPK